MTVISAGREVEQGARSMLLLAEGLFRLDVVPQDDMVQTVIRNLSPAPRVELRFHAVGGESSVLDGRHEVAVRARPAASAARWSWSRRTARSGSSRRSWSARSATSSAA